MPHDIDAPLRNGTRTPDPPPRPQRNEIVVYQPDETLRLDVRLENETVWLNRLQMARLFGRDVKTIGKHIANALREELSDAAMPPETSASSVASIATIREDANPTVAKFATVQIEGGREVVRQVEYYSLDVILSVGYRVKSARGILFRRWANAVLRDYLLRGYAVNERFAQIEDRMDRRLSEHGRRLDALESRVDFFVRTQTPPLQGVFYDGQLWDARAFVDKLVKSAKKSLLLVDNFSRMPPRDSVAGGIRRFFASLGLSLLRKRGHLFPSSRQLVVSSSSSSGRGATRRGHSNPARAGGLPPRARPGFPFRRFSQRPRQEVLRLHEDGRRGDPRPKARL